MSDGIVMLEVADTHRGVDWDNTNNGINTIIRYL